ncbi:MAG: lipid-A-disaccharide synthase N-terminal domain-containing protein [Patescibacteria group bacterium]
MSNVLIPLFESLANPWVIFGFTAQFIFFLRFVVQLLASEKNKRTTIPVSFWYLSILGALMILIYAIYKQDIVFIVGQGLSLLIYLRNLFIYYKAPKEALLEESVIVPPTKSLWPEGSFLLATVVFLGIAGTVLYLSVTKERVYQPPLYSAIDALEAMWTEYKVVYIEPTSGRTLDKEEGNITTSEGQSYSMLRAVFMDDIETFEFTWDWTKDILLRDDFLLSWKFGQLPDGSYGVLNNIGGENTASDSDIDIALALFLGYGRWGNETYLNEGRAIINSVWDNEVVEIDGVPYLMANNREKDSADPWLIINPSYLAPYAFKVFAQIDTTHNWDGLVDSSYEIYERSARLALDKSHSVWLTPNWIEINRDTGEIRAAVQPNLDTNFGYDALRTPWRIALDYKWFKDPRALTALRDFWYLERLWSENGYLPSVVSHDGVIIEAEEKMEMYAGTLPYFAIMHPETAEAIYNTKIINQYDRNKFLWVADPGYYGSNWGWFGIAFYNNRLPNYTERFLTDTTL